MPLVFSCLCTIRSNICQSNIHLPLKFVEQNVPLYLLVFAMAKGSDKFFVHF